MKPFSRTNQAHLKVFCQHFGHAGRRSIALMVVAFTAEENMAQARTIDASIQPHNERTAAVWSAGGDGYDAISRQIAPALEHCVARLDPKHGEKILDLATGTGWTSRLIARRGADVVGADIADGLLAAATERAKQESLKIEYQLGDAERLPFSDASFDGVISTFGVMFAAHPGAAAGELARVCKRGGRVALATWLPDSSVFKMFLVMRRFMPPSPSPAPPSPFEWGNKDRVQALLASDFDLEFEEGTATYFGPEGAAVWDAFAVGYGPTKALANSLDERRRTEFKDAFTAFHDDYRTALGITVPRQYLITFGRRK
jgi:SAM-dependent methyltransferase